MFHFVRGTRSQTETETETEQMAIDDVVDPLTSPATVPAGSSSFTGSVGSTSTSAAVATATPTTATPSTSDNIRKAVQEHLHRLTDALVTHEDEWSELSQFVKSSIRSMPAHLRGACRQEIQGVVVKYLSMGLDMVSTL